MKKAEPFNKQLNFTTMKNLTKEEIKLMTNLLSYIKTNNQQHECIKIVNSILNKITN